MKNTVFAKIDGIVIGALAGIFLLSPFFNAGAHDNS